MNDIEKKKVSKFLSLILRHSPEIIKLKLDKNGWANVDELITKSRPKIKLTVKVLEEVIATNDKKRFSFNNDKTKVRANQGHSLKNINLEFESIKPPLFLYHGTVSKFMQSIKEEGLQKMNRQYVHLSKDRTTAINVGNRRGKAIVLSIRSGDMYKQGYIFHCSENGVWLTENVPTKFIDF